MHRAEHTLQVYNNWTFEDPAGGIAYEVLGRTPTHANKGLHATLVDGVTQQPLCEVRKTDDDNIALILFALLPDYGDGPTTTSTRSHTVLLERKSTFRHIYKFTFEGRRFRWDPALFCDLEVREEETGYKEREFVAGFEETTLGAHAEGTGTLRFKSDMLGEGIVRDGRGLEILLVASFAVMIKMAEASKQKKEKRMVVGQEVVRENQLAYY